MFLYSLLQLLLIYYALMVSFNFLKALVSDRRSLKSKGLMVVLGSGGHTTEMLLMLKSLKFEKYRSTTFIIGHSDTWSMSKIKDFFRKTQNIIDIEVHPNVKFVRLFRSRQVKQSYLTSIATTLLALVHSCLLVVQHNPDLIVTNGPGTTVPLCYASFLIQRVLLLNFSAKILFVESFCRVTSLSLTGKLLKPIVSKFIVHWEELKQLYPKAILYEEKLF